IAKCHVVCLLAYGNGNPDLTGVGVRYIYKFNKWWILTEKIRLSSHMLCNSFSQCFSDLSSFLSSTSFQPSDPPIRPVFSPLGFSSISKPLYGLSYFSASQC